MTRVITPCANCGHDRPAHWHYPGSGLRPGGHGKCLNRDCPCERYVKEPTEREARSVTAVVERPFDVSEWADAPRLARAEDVEPNELALVRRRLGAKRAAAGGRRTKP